MKMRAPEDEYLVCGFSLIDVITPGFEDPLGRDRGRCKGNE